MLPVLNRRVVEFAIRPGSRPAATIAPRSRWARKNYFYPDLPKGYQISQYERRSASAARVDIDRRRRAERRVRLTRIHMEEDAGKNIHDAHGDASLVDLNRAGVPLLEIVSEPDLRTPAEAGAYLRKLRAILQYLEVCDGNMEEGSFRCDANVSVRPRGQRPRSARRAEIKNMNSFRAVERALELRDRAADRALASGGARSCRRRGCGTPTARSRARCARKEEAHDYRYFPEPDLPPLVVGREWVEEVRAELPELPAARRERFVREYRPARLRRRGADRAHATSPTTSKPRSRAHANPKAIGNWVMGDVLRLVRERKLDDALRDPRLAGARPSTSPTSSR